MSKNTVRFLIADAAVLAMFLLVTLAIPFERNACFWAAFVFGILSILVQLFTLPYAVGGKSPKSKFYGFPVAKVSLVWLGVQIALSIAFMASSRVVPAWVATVVSCVVLCIAALGFITTDTVREEATRQDTAIKTDVAFMRDLKSKAESLASACAGMENAGDIKKLAENIIYSDPVSSEAFAGAEKELDVCFEMLRRAAAEGNSAEASVFCRKASAALEERNRICKNSKRK